MRMEQACVVLTGAAGGLGAEVARHLVHAGARVLLVGRSKEPLLQLATTLCAGAPDRSRVDALVVDVSTTQGRAAVCDAARARNANLLINNAAVPAFGPASRLTPERAAQLVATNVLAPMQLAAGLLPHLLAQPQAQIVNVGSTLGSVGVPGFAAYGASKAALRSYSESLRRELAGTRVKVQYFAPRTIGTPFNDHAVRAFNEATGSRADAPAAVARKLLAFLRSEKPEYFVGLAEHLGARLNGLCPRLLDGVFARHRRALLDLADPAAPFLQGEQQ